ncbi:MAG: divalent-cation tolerance protein CutA [Candidatus Wallbacteria bacterium HGW-Wallbacteria-1]|jgi:periplasmic divalent cation tolerance protein|uniref:Divalent-cation tolerance protein CutA n=1 Tax=Candidatus Wallbacteria bacterium HGW-Wallbacteria-1 TaxID=2013854 RepID=A0A2N1PLI5_9BACT|nr:MAG: divalent-cation tolerance protein CutA [Candidatus Wallbacteria bacterium HGW-Wallbacteria-1]
MMTNTTGVVAVLVTCPTREVAEMLGRGAVEDNIAACSQVLGEIRSFYRWEGKVCDDQEFLVIFKIAKNSFDALEAFILAKHPYDIPQIVALPVVDGNLSYISWVLETMG